LGGGKNLEKNRQTTSEKTPTDFGQSGANSCDMRHPVLKKEKERQLLGERNGSKDISLMIGGAFARLRCSEDAAKTKPT